MICNVYIQLRDTLHTHYTVIQCTANSVYTTCTQHIHTLHSVQCIHYIHTTHSYNAKCTVINWDSILKNLASNSWNTVNLELHYNVQYLSLQKIGPQATRSHLYPHYQTKHRITWFPAIQQHTSTQPVPNHSLTLIYGNILNYTLICCW